MGVIESKGCQLLISNGASPEVFNAVGQVTDISGPDGSTPEIDKSDLDSQAREFILGLPDEGSVSLTLNFDSADNYQEDLRDAKINRTLIKARIQLSDSPSTKITFEGYVTEFPLNIAVDTIVTVQTTIRISGPVVWS